MMNLHWLQHVPFEGAGMIAGWTRQKGYSLNSTRLYLDEKLPDPDRIDALVIMGGPMSVNDEKKYGWLTGEKRFIESVIALNRPVLGICLGAQLIANVLGSNVYPGPEKEIGWFPLSRTSDGDASPYTSTWPDRPTVFHWHGETFDLPEGAVRLATTGPTANQAFSWGGSVVGLQFHLEMEEADIERIIENCRDELTGGLYIQSEAGMIAQTGLLSQTHSMMTSLLESLIG